MSFDIDSDEKEVEGKAHNNNANTKR